MQVVCNCIALAMQMPICIIVVYSSYRVVSLRVNYYTSKTREVHERGSVTFRHKVGGRCCRMVPRVYLGPRNNQPMTPEPINPLDYRFGTEFTATVDGVDTIVYLSIRCDGKDASRRDHCYRYGRGTATPHDIIGKDAEVVILALQGRNKAPRL